jgi:hypothetical protein
MVVLVDTRDENQPHMVVRDVRPIPYTGAYLVDVFPHGTSQRDARSSGTTRAAVVPWSYEPDCTTAPWTGASWLDSGAIAFVLPDPVRPESLWVEGYPTYDLFLAWHLTFPRPGAPHDAHAATAWQYAEFFEHLPTATEWEQDSLAALRRLVVWARTAHVDRRPSIDWWLRSVREMVEKPH